jgi:hypothetical protein
MRDKSYVVSTRPNHLANYKMSVFRLQTGFIGRQIFCKPFRYRHSRQHVLLSKDVVKGQIDYDDSK